VGPPISGQDVSKSRTKQEPDLQYGKRERKEPRLGRPFYLVKILQLRAGRRKGRRSAVVRNLVSGYRRRVEFGYIWASHFSFPACCQKVLPLSIHNQARGATWHAQRAQTLPTAS
jgi:hypothetical protein